MRQVRDFGVRHDLGLLVDPMWPTLETIGSFTDQAASQAELYGGAYDGWETSLES